jgi:transcriptional antiterminator NusG
MEDDRIVLTELETIDAEAVPEEAEMPLVEETPAEVPSDEAPLVEETPAEETLAEAPLVEETPAEETSDEEPSAEAPLVEETPAEETSDEEPSAEAPLVEETPAEETLAEETSAEAPLVEETPAEETSDEEPSAEAPLIEETPVEEPSDEAPLVEETPAEETPAEEPSDEAPLVEETPAEEPSDEVPLVEETPAEEPSDEAPLVEETPAEVPSDEAPPAEAPSEEAPPLEPEDVARQLFASYLEPSEDEEVEQPDADVEIDQLEVTDGAELKLLADEEDEAESDEEGAEEGGRNWFVIHSYSGYENKVRKNLEHRIESLGMQNKIFEVVVPTEDEIELKDGQRRTVERRIFPGYILVEMLMDEDSWYVVRNTPGVTGFVGSVRRPTPLRQRDVDRILKRMRAETPRVKVTFVPGQKVRICDGPFEDFVGAVDDIYPDKGKVRILVSFFGRETPVELDFLQVEKI